LVNTAVRKFRGDIITVEPDQLRDFHPDVKSFRETGGEPGTGLCLSTRQAGLAAHKKSAPWGAFFASSM
jgi:hypothetical protein